MTAPPGNLKAGIFASVAGVFGSALLWLFSFKVIAYWMGPEGVGLFSQLRQVAQAATVASTYGGTNPVVQGLSERTDAHERQRFRGTASRLIASTGLSMSLLMLLFSPQLARFFLASDAADIVASLRWICLAVAVNVAGTYALAVLNGYRSYAWLALSQIAGPVSLVALLAFAYWQHIPPRPELLGISFVVCFGVTLLVGALGVWRLPRIPQTQPVGRLTAEERRVFVRFALSSLAAALSTTLALLLIRAWVINARGLAFAGLFDAGWTLTFNYTTLFLTACSAIYLPLLTRATEEQSQRNCMLKTAYLVLAGSVPVCYCMVFLKVPLINLLYSPQFQPSGDVLVVLVIAVIFRAISWVYGTMILATRNSRVLLISDVALNVGLLAAVKFALTHYSSLASLAWAFVLPNFLYLVFVVEYAAYKNHLMLRRYIWPLLFVASAPLFFLALVGLQDTGAQWFYLAIGIAVSAASLLAYKKVLP
jgi:antigen flippase